MQVKKPLMQKQKATIKDIYWKLVKKLLLNLQKDKMFGGMI